MRFGWIATLFLLATAPVRLAAQAPAATSASPGDAPADPGPLATQLSGSVKPSSVRAAMKLVADWQTAQLATLPESALSRDWTFAALYVGLLAAADTLDDKHDRILPQRVAEHFGWTLGPRTAHADDQAIAQTYLALDRRNPAPLHLAPLQAQFAQLALAPDDPAQPVWWWCDALFMAPPVWAELAAATHDPRPLDVMDHQWHRTDNLLWDEGESLFFRDRSFLPQHEKNGRPLFWSRGNGWVMGGLVRVLEAMPAHDPRRTFYVHRLQRMANAVARVQGADGLWRPGLLDANAYPLPEVSGSAFFVYAISWGVHHHLLDPSRFNPVLARGWAGLVAHIYRDGRLGSIQPIGAAPGAYPPSASYVYGVGAFLLAGAELSKATVKAP